ncbi:Receptor-type tyrosine-protein phosphatase beta [Tolypocladium capitatum]|uniref:Receptor-type tyrosine-protein phosphatase beta n=1 Tax=Tolypocladium capitatum TaxID=45235 RepID=A0A2K3QQJ0_9HYPO|nr:Receptor-type tyrosine-protein phosphatase beta [Tolypocladium capitatum]
MDRIPRLRRKPKPPAIETSVERVGRDAAASLSDGELPQHSNRNHQRSAGNKSPFRSLQMRASAKRARGTSPADLPASSPVAAVFSQHGVAPHALSRGANAGHHETNGHQPRPEIPGFLALSTQEIDRRFLELTWAERLRLADAHRNHDIENYKWGHYQQHDLHQRGVMDRYNNIRPWNYNRVRIRVPDDEFDYVNASTVTLSSPSNAALPPLRYIAMQGPTEPSLDYVWRMIAEQMPSPAVIVQLTTMRENGFVKCHQYFPHCADESTWTLNEDDVWGDGWTAQLTFVSLDESGDDTIEIRKLLLDVEGEDETRVIWHFLYRQWPDFGVPSFEDMDSFFELMKLSREYSAPSGPRIVHCSAGVGRTGTFISLEHLMRELDAGAFAKYHSSAKTPDLIFDTVESLRQQRRGMVQGEIQYQFIYHVMRRLWREKYGVPEDDCGEPAAKRLVVADPFTDESNDSQDDPEPAPEAGASTDTSR